MNSANQVGLWNDGGQLLASATIPLNATLENGIYGAGGQYKLKDGRDNDRLYGLDNNDRIFGQLGDEQLYGGYGDDTLDGVLGKHTLLGCYYGKEGGQYETDILAGGAGVDILQLGWANYCLAPSGVSGIGLYAEQGATDELIAIIRSANSTVLNAANTVNTALFV